MLAKHERVSDLNITVGKSLQVESDGILVPVDVNPPVTKLTPFQTEVFALNLIGGNRRLLHDLISKGSCDLSYSLHDKVRFRVNVFSQKGYLTTILRKLETKIPSMEGFNFPEAFVKMSQERNGLILFTGSTGSGKTTSMAAILNLINEERAVHIVTLEDPIEYVHPHKKATFNQREMGDDFDTFAGGLRAALRQAPKVILVGEIRDRETAEIAIHAALTGHLVFSTLHTNDAPGAVSRMLDMGVEAFLISSSLSGVLSQRLVRKICTVCNGTGVVDKDGNKCKTCAGSGFKGRVGIFELMIINDEIRQCINKEMDSKDIAQTAMKYGMRPLLDDGMKKVAKGITTKEEVTGVAVNVEI